MKNYQLYSAIDKLTPNNLRQKTPQTGLKILKSHFFITIGFFFLFKGTDIQLQIID